jgi:hypothetical protein
VTSPPKPPLVDLGATAEDLARVILTAAEEHQWRYRLERFGGGPLCITLVKPPRCVFFVVLSTAGHAGPEALAWVNALRRVPSIRAEVIRPELAEAAVKLLAPATRGPEDDRWRPL